MQPITSHGGPRPNSGRKPVPDAERKQHMAIRIDPEVREYLRQCSNATAAIESAIRNSKAFRLWKKS